MYYAIKHERYIYLHNRTETIQDIRINDIYGHRPLTIK